MDKYKPLRTYIKCMNQGKVDLAIKIYDKYNISMKLPNEEE